MKRTTLLLCLALLPFAARGDCTLTNVGITPLPDLGFQNYKGFSGGLYPKFANQPPPAHFAAGVSIAENEITPLDTSGNVDTNSGKIVLLSLSMSNGTHEWAIGDTITDDKTRAFKYRADNDPSKNPKVIIVDGAISGEDAAQWTNVDAPDWTTVITQRLPASGVTTNQVQAIWLKQAVAGPLNHFGAFPLHAQALQNMLATIVRNASFHYPNLKLVYLSCRTRAYTDTPPTAQNPEPFAFETGFADKWVIEDQITGQNNLNFNPSNGPVVAPWIAWGPYIWADGLNPRSDGFIWNCDDVRQNDFTHPASNGVFKVATHLLAFFKTDPTTTPWFLRKTIVGQPPNCAPTASATAGVIPLTVNFAANASDPDGSIHDIYWTFDDGTFSTNANPTKIFKSAGTHVARVTVTDNDGNPVIRSLPITVAPVALADPLIDGNVFQVGILGATNYDFVVQRSDDLASWLPVATNHGPFTFTETNAVPSRGFYRALLQP
jgi:PKD domain